MVYSLGDNYFWRKMLGTFSRNVFMKSFTHRLSTTYFVWIAIVYIQASKETWITPRYLSTTQQFPNTNSVFLVLSRALHDVSVLFNHSFSEQRHWSSVVLFPILASSRPDFWFQRNGGVYAGTKNSLWPSWLSFQEPNFNAIRGRTTSHLTGVVFVSCSSSLVTEAWMILHLHFCGKAMHKLRDFCVLLEVRKCALHKFWILRSENMIENMLRKGFSDLLNIVFTGDISRTSKRLLCEWR